MNLHDQITTIIRLATDFANWTDSIHLSKRDLARFVKGYGADSTRWYLCGTLYRDLMMRYDRREEVLRQLRDAINATPDY